MSDNKINKSSLKEAKANFDEIKNFAIEEATKNLQEDVSKKVIELMNKSLEEKTENINEDITIKIDNGGNVEVETEKELTPTDDVENINNEESIDFDSEEEIIISDEDDEIEVDNTELKEMQFEEQEAETNSTPTPAPAPAPAPTPESEVETIEQTTEETTQEETIANPFQALMDKMDQMMSMIGGNAENSGEEVEIIDDTDVATPTSTPASTEEPAPASTEQPNPAPVAEEITFEVVDNEEDSSEIEFEEDEILEIVDELEDEDEFVDEVKMMGQSHTVQKTTGTSAGPEIAKKERERLAIKENKNNAHYEAKIAELIKENKSLKMENKELESELSKFENSFIKLQENFGQMQDYNAKLVMAYKVAMSGGLTTDEKIQISEQFDKCESVEDAEKLYKSIVSEHKIKVNKNPEKSIKSTTIKSTPAKSVSQPLYESVEVARMKELAGIKKNQL